MNTGIRRFILRLAVGLLAFLIGVTAVWALGGLNPFRGSSSTQYYHYKRGCHHRNWDSPSNFGRFEEESNIDDPIFLKGPHGCRMKREFSELPPPPPLAPAPPVAR